MNERLFSMPFGGFVVMQLERVSVAIIPMNGSPHGGPAQRIHLHRCCSMAPLLAVSSMEPNLGETRKQNWPSCWLKYHLWVKVDTQLRADLQNAPPLYLICSKMSVNGLHSPNVPVPSSTDAETGCIYVAAFTLSLITPLEAEIAFWRKHSHTFPQVN